MDILTLKTALLPDTSVGFTSTVVVSGFLVVLLILTILIIVFSVFSNTISRSQRKNGKKKEEKAIMTQDLKVVSPFNDSSSVSAAPIVQAPPQTQGVSEEIVAAISAAVYMMEGEGAVVKSITPAAQIRQNPIKTRNPWAMAAIMQNTKPF